MNTIQIDDKLYMSAPSPENRAAKEMRSYEVLEKLGIPYTRLDHEETATIEDCHGVDEKLGIQLCKNLFLCNSAKNKFYLLMMPGTKKFKTKDLSAQIQSSRLSFAGVKYMEKFLDITPGSVSVLGLMNDKERQVQLLIDKDLLDMEEIGCHPCVNTASLKIKSSDLMEKFLPYTGHKAIVVEL